MIKHIPSQRLFWTIELVLSFFELGKAAISQAVKKLILLFLAPTKKVSAKLKPKAQKANFQRKQTKFPNQNQFFQTGNLKQNKEVN